MGKATRPQELCGGTIRIAYTFCLVLRTERRCYTLAETDHLKQVQRDMNAKMKMAAKHRIPKVSGAHKGMQAMTPEMLLSKLTGCCPEWDWTKPGTTPLEWNKEKWDSMFEECGFGIVQFASGEKLRDIQQKIKQQWRGGIKEAIVNRSEWVSKEGNKERCWSAIEEDAGRIQVYLEDNEIPGADIIRGIYPTLDPRTPANTPCVRLCVILGNHPAATAQQFHWDQIPSEVAHPSDPRNKSSVKETLGSCALVCPFPTLLDVIPFSHKWEAENGRFIPGKIFIPEGKVCMFATIAHGGYGIWDVYQSMFRAVPSADDLMSTSPDDWEIRYQCHVARGPDYHPLTVIVGEQVGYKNVDQIYKYIDFDHNTVNRNISTGIQTAGRSADKH